MVKQTPAPHHFPLADAARGSVSPVSRRARIHADDFDYNIEAMDTLSVLRSRRSEILALAAKHGASNVRLFGSVVRGEDLEDSDVDFLVDMQENRSLFDLIGLQQDIEKAIGRKVDVLTPNGINRHLKDRIMDEAAPL